ncbi:DUF6188 family protein [Gordonia liuliyuniae]|uniref:DUF6188 family protein n=1 Tax=Gordonia liuliyuniae TaxID=2911517 RepID=UPI003556FE9E
MESKLMKEIPISGSTVVGITAGYAINIALSNGGGISIEDPVRIVSGAGIVAVDPSSGSPDVSPIEKGILDRRVEGASCGDDYTLSVLLDNGVALIVAPNKDGYESWSVSVPPDYYIVGNAEFS